MTGRPSPAELVSVVLPCVTQVCHPAFAVRAKGGGLYFRYFLHNIAGSCCTTNGRQDNWPQPVKKGIAAEGLHMKASSLSFKLAVLFVIAGMSMGMGMAISQDHSIMPAHAHLNLLGWVSLFLFGTYYERRPALDASRLAIIQVWGWSIGTAVLTFGVAAEHMGYDNLAPFAAVGALIVFAGVLLFAYFVFRPPTSMASGPAVGLTPAE
jgi:hypothetical protein